MDAARVELVELVERFPGAADYCRLRAEAGMAPRTLEAARRGLPNTLYGVSLLLDGQVVGMGRVIGDDGCFFIVVDIAVTPALQGQGLGKRIMTALDGCSAPTRRPRRWSRWWPMATRSTFTPDSALSKPPRFR